MTQFSDGLRVGAAYYGRAVDVSGPTREDRGVPLSNLVAVQYGAVATADAGGICVAATATGAATLSATGALVSGGVATLDVPRCVSVTATANNSGINITVVGTDQYGEALRATIAGPNNNTVLTPVAFRTVTAVQTSGATVSALNVGSADSLGLPYRIANAGQVVSASVDGAAASHSYIVGLTASAVSTATTADVRGIATLATGALPNGSRNFTILVVANPSTKETLYGQAPFGG